MVELSERQIIEYWHRSYRTVDGLWFVKVEERYGFDTALDIDNAVWAVFPKIQARMIREMGGLEKDIRGLYEAVETKLNLEGFIFKAEKIAGSGSFEIRISECPWHNIMNNSGRRELSGKVGTLICNTEYSVWASEFGDSISFELGDQICEGDKTCVLRFSSSSSPSG
jgi:hypothetical protein